MENRFFNMLLIAYSYSNKLCAWRHNNKQACRNFGKFIGIFYKLRWKVSFNVLKSLYFAFVHPHLLYGIEVYGNSSLSHLNKLIILNNKLLRIVQNKSLRTPVIELYRNFNTLPLPQLHQFQLLCLVHKYLHCRSQLPIVFSKYFYIKQGYPPL